MKREEILGRPFHPTATGLTRLFPFLSSTFHNFNLSPQSSSPFRFEGLISEGRRYKVYYSTAEEEEEAASPTPPLSWFAARGQHDKSRLLR